MHRPKSSPKTVQVISKMTTEREGGVKHESTQTQPGGVCCDCISLLPSFFYPFLGDGEVSREVQVEDCLSQPKGQHLKAVLVKLV